MAYNNHKLRGHFLNTLVGKDDKKNGWMEISIGMVAVMLAITYEKSVGAVPTIDDGRVDYGRVRRWG